MDTADYTIAKTELDAAIAEHNTKYGNTPEQKRDFNYGEKIMMERAQRHLKTVIDNNDPSFLYYPNSDVTIGNPTIKHHSDIIKEALQRTPKTDYSEVITG